MSRRLRRLRREIGRYLKAGPKLREIGWRDWKDLFRAQMALAQARREMRTLPTGDMVRDTKPPVSMDGVPDRTADARRIALAVNRAAAYGWFRPKCLVKSRALRRMLDDEGIGGAEVRVGVFLRDEKFLAHAWVEYRGQVVGDDPAFVALYVPMTGIQVAGLE